MTLLELTETFARLAEGGQSPNGGIFDPLWVEQLIASARAAAIVQTVNSTGFVNPSWRQTGQLLYSDAENPEVSPGGAPCFVRFSGPLPLSARVPQHSPMLNEASLGKSRSKPLIRLDSVAAMHDALRARGHGRGIYAFESGYYYVWTNMNRVLTITGVFSDPRLVPGFDPRGQYPVTEDLVPAMEQTFLRLIGMAVAAADPSLNDGASVKINPPR